MITLGVLRAICPASRQRTLEPWVEHLNAAMEEFDINSPKREAAFLAQVAHESGGFQHVREIASGQDYDTGRKAERLGNTPEDDDDGVLYKGRGLIQITGLNNVRECSTFLTGDPDLFIYRPELMERYDYASRSAAWYWRRHGCNELADKDAFSAITKAINGGMNGWQDRNMYWDRAKRVVR